MENPLMINSSAMDVAGNCSSECELSAEDLAVAECVLRVLDDGIEKLQIAMLIPLFLDNKELLKKAMPVIELKKCYDYYNEYMRHAEAVQGSSQQSLHISLIEMIDMFCENRYIKGVLPEFVSKIPGEHMELINALRQLRNIAEVRLNTSALIEMRREKIIHGIYQDNEKISKVLVKQKKQLREQEVNLRWKLGSKQAVIKKYEDELATAKWENNMKIKQEILKSSQKIKEIQNESVTKQEALSDELEKAKQNYEKVLKMNARNEKDLRDEKNKLLLQLLGLIKKYDQNIGDKVQENEELQKVYDKQKQELDDFLVGYSVKEAEYNELAQRKLQEETDDFNRKLYLFMSTRAAKIIQRYWRKYLKSIGKVFSKKGKKGKGKK